MAFLEVTKTVQPYVLSYDQQSPDPTVWWLRPMSAEDSELFQARWRKWETQRGMPDEVRARKKTACDREQLQLVLAKVENKGTDWLEPDDPEFKERISIDNTDEIAQVVNRLSWGDLQELLRAAQSPAMLQESRKNSYGFSSSGPRTAPAPNPQATAGASPANGPTRGLSTIGEAAPATQSSFES